MNTQQLGPATLWLLRTTNTMPCLDIEPPNTGTTSSFQNKMLLLQGLDPPNEETFHPGTCPVEGPFSLGWNRTEAKGLLEWLQMAAVSSPKVILLEIALHYPVTHHLTRILLMARHAVRNYSRPHISLHSTQLPRPGHWSEYCVMASEVLLLLLTLLHTCVQLLQVMDNGWVVHRLCLHRWFEILLITVSGVYVIHSLWRTTVTGQILTLLERHGPQKQVDISDLITHARVSQDLGMLLLFLLVLKGIGLLRIFAPTTSILDGIFTACHRLLPVLLILPFTALAYLSMEHLSPGSSHCGLLEAVLSLLQGMLNPLLHSKLQEYFRISDVSHPTVFITFHLIIVTSIWAGTVFAGVQAVLQKKQNPTRSRQQMSLTLRDAWTFMRECAANILGRNYRPQQVKPLPNLGIDLQEFEDQLNELVSRMDALTGFCVHPLVPTSCLDGYKHASKEWLNNSQLNQRHFKAKPQRSSVDCIAIEGRPFDLETGQHVPCNPDKADSSPSLSRDHTFGCQLPVHLLTMLELDFELNLEFNPICSSCLNKSNDVTSSSSLGQSKSSVCSTESLGFSSTSCCSETNDNKPFPSLCATCVTWPVIKYPKSKRDWNTASCLENMLHPEPPSPPSNPLSKGVLLPEKYSPIDGTFPKLCHKQRRPLRRSHAMTVHRLPNQTTLSSPGDDVKHSKNSITVVEVHQQSATESRDHDGL
uniref:polycystin-1-like protein 1 n=1 Tax=Myxine glutinosa TaxID=7769 RepID=UPI00358DEBDA